MSDKITFNDLDDIQKQNFMNRLKTNKLSLEDIRFIYSQSEALSDSDKAKLDNDIKEILSIINNVPLDSLKIN